MRKNTTARIAISSAAAIVFFVELTIAPSSLYLPIGLCAGSPARFIRATSRMEMTLLPTG